jgi:signal transduction histidine kinase
MLRNTFARLRSVRVRITLIATILTGVALTVAAVLLVSAVENRLEDQVREDTRRAADKVAVALQAGQPFDQAVSAPALGTYVYIVGDSGDVLAASTGPVGAGLSAVGPLPDPSLLSGGAPVEITQQIVSAAGPGGALRVVAASPLADVQRSVSELSRLLWVGIPILVVLVGGLAWVLVGRALKPVDSMRREADEISHSTLHRRVPEPTSGDEVARLAHTMNAMLDRLEGAADRQRQFVSDASHELKSPLTTIRAKVEVASMHPAEADWTDVSATVLGEVDRLDDMVGDLLQLARLDETGGSLSTRTAVDLDELVAAEAARLRGLGVAVDDSGLGAARVQGDRSALTRLVRNLADNAARHARSTVGLSVTNGDGTAVIRVDDDGSGVPVADRERVFERFTRLDEGRARGAGGAGLGLALVRAVAAAHGGTVSVLEAPQGGARFEVRLPTQAN